MSPYRLAVTLALSATLTIFAEDPKLPGIGTAMEDMIAKNEIAGAVTSKPPASPMSPRSVQ
jgi:hypothetical protein